MVPPAVKYVKLLKVLAMALWVVLVPIRPALMSVMLLPMVDLLLALACAKKNKQPILSSGLKRTVGKVLMYEAATILAFVTESYMLGGLIPVVKIVTGLIGITELKSCLEHLDDLGGNPLFASILGFLAPGQLNPTPTLNITETIDSKPSQAPETAPSEPPSSPSNP